MPTQETLDQLSIKDEIINAFRPIEQLFKIMETLEKALGNRIKALRKLKGWTQEKLAEQAGVSIQHVGEIERGDGNPTLQSLDRLAKGLGVSVSYLLAVEEEEQEAETLRTQVADEVKGMTSIELKLLRKIINLSKTLSIRKSKLPQ